MKRFFALLAGLLPGLATLVKVRDIHHLDAKIQKAYDAWKTIYGFIGVPSALSQTPPEPLADEATQQLMRQMADAAAVPVAERVADAVPAAPAAPVHVTA